MVKIGCIVMYSKPIDNNKTIPCGTVFYDDGTEKEISLKEAAEKALEMSLEYGYSNAIENERYFNTTYDDFLKEKEKYKEIAKKQETKKEIPNIIKEKMDKEIKYKLPPHIEEVEPPAVVRDETNKKEEKEVNEEQIIDNIIKSKLDDLNPKEEEKSKEEIDFQDIEKKLSEMMEQELNKEDNNKTTSNDLNKMIYEQNKRVQEENSIKR